MHRGAKLKRHIALTAVIAAAAGCEPPPPLVPPSLRGEVRVDYPEDLWDAGLEGETVLRVHVATDGRADTVRVQRPSGHAAFDSAAARAASRLAFEPARRGAEPVAIWVALPVRFKLDRDPAGPRGAVP